MSKRKHARKAKTEPEVDIELERDTINIDDLNVRVPRVKNLEAAEDRFNLFLQCNGRPPHDKMVELGLKTHADGDVRVTDEASSNSEEEFEERSVLLERSIPWERFGEELAVEDRLAFSTSGSYSDELERGFDRLLYKTKSHADWKTAFARRFGLLHRFNYTTKQGWVMMHEVKNAYFVGFYMEQSSSGELGESTQLKFCNFFFVNPLEQK